MNADEFREAAMDMANYIVGYSECLDDSYTALPKVQQGFLTKQIPKNPPNKPEKWTTILKDTQNIFVPGLTHWQHIKFNAYFPAAANYEGVLADALGGTLAVNGTSWAACPAATELEVVVADWLAKAYGLPKKFLHSETNSIGGGILMTTASEVCVLTMVAAKNAAITYLRSLNGNEGKDDFELMEKLIAYCSVEAHSSVEKAAMVCLIRLRLLEVDANSSLRGETVKKALDEDIAMGLHPFYVVGSIGTTGSTGVDNIDEIGKVIKKYPALWYHIDGAYGVCSFICPEKRIQGLDYANSLGNNPNKWLQINFEGSIAWTDCLEKFGTALLDSANYPDPERRNRYELRHMGISLSRKFKAIRHWVSLRSFGIEKLQSYIRSHCELAKHFERLVRKDLRFEVVNQVTMGLVCFRLKSDQLTEKLLQAIIESRELFLIPCNIQNKFVIRFSVNNNKTFQDIEESWSTIVDKATKVIEDDFKESNEEAMRYLTAHTPPDLERKRLSVLSDEVTPASLHIEPESPRHIHEEQEKELPNIMGTGAYKRRSLSD